MKSLGISRRLDNLGRYVIPSEIRKNLDIKEKDILEVYTDGDKIILRKVEECCTFCKNKAFGSPSFQRAGTGKV